jgi:hypothetical protein
MPWVSVDDMKLVMGTSMALDFFRYLMRQQRNPAAYLLLVGLILVLRVVLFADGNNYYH